MIIEAWNYQKYYTDITIPDALKVVNSVQNNTGVTPLNEINSTVSTLPNSTTLTQAILDWAGYSPNQMSDSELLRNMGIDAQHIPTWVSKPADWLANNQISEQDFVNIVKYLYEHNMIK